MHATAPCPQDSRARAPRSVNRIPGRGVRSVSRSGQRVIASPVWAERSQADTGIVTNFGVGHSCPWLAPAHRPSTSRCLARRHPGSPPRAPSRPCGAASGRAGSRCPRAASGCVAPPQFASSSSIRHSATQPITSRSMSPAPAFSSSPERYILPWRIGVWLMLRLTCCSSYLTEDFR